MQFSDFELGLISAVLEFHIRELEEDAAIAVESGMDAQGEYWRARAAEYRQLLAKITAPTRSSEQKL